MKVEGCNRVRTWIPLVEGTSYGDSKAKSSMNLSKRFEVSWWGQIMLGSMNHGVL